MKNYFLKFSGIIAMTTLFACNFQTNSGSGVIFSEVKEPVAYNNGVSSIKIGQSCQESWFGLFSMGDSSIEAAKAMGKISKISSINLERKNIIVYGKSCTVVRGE